VYNRGAGMKRRLLIKLLKNNGWYYKRDGGNHEIYTNGIDCESVSRQKEIDEIVAQKIIKRRGLV
jgi:predicted RNA binding protein YcfA (HicA-like mRNA interferase family)